MDVPIEEWLSTYCKLPQYIDAFMSNGFESTEFVRNMITVPISSYNQLIPPQYFVRIIYDKWLGTTTILPISFRNLILPSKYKEKTELLDLQPLPIDNNIFPHLYKHKYLIIYIIQIIIY